MRNHTLEAPTLVRLATAVVWIACFHFLLPETAAAQCGGLCLYEVGTPDSSRSAAGAGARAQDAATALWNPAGMTELEGTHVQVGSVFGFVDTEYDGGAFHDDGAGGNDAGTEEGGQIGTLIPLGSGFVSVPVWEKLRFGFALAALYGGEADYNNDWVGRTFVTEVSLSALILQPSLAYPVTDWLSLGAGVSVMYAWMDLSLRDSHDIGPPNGPAATLKINDANDWAAAAIVSALVKWGDHTRFGLYYRSKTELSLKGDVQGTPLSSLDFKGDMNFAQGINLSVAHVLNDTVTLYADTGWTNWDQFSDQSWKFSGDVGGITLEIDRDWKDTWRLGVGADWQVMEKLMLQAGFGYDSSPVKDSKRLPDIPVGEAYRFSVGQRFTPVEHVELFASYTGLWSGDPDVDGVTLPDGTVMNGKYQPSWIHFVTMGMTVNF